MRTNELFVPVVLALFMGTFLGLGLFSFQYSLTVMRFPLIVGLVTCALCGLRIAQVVSAGRQGGPGPDDERREVSPPAVKPVAFGALWLLGVIPILYLLGYLAGLPLYVFLYLKLHGEGWLMAGGLALLCLAVAYGVFMNALGVPLPVHPIGWP